MMNAQFEITFRLTLEYEVSQSHNLGSKNPKITRRLIVGGRA